MPLLPLEANGITEGEGKQCFSNFRVIRNWSGSELVHQHITGSVALQEDQRRPPKKLLQWKMPALPVIAELERMAVNAEMGSFTGCGH
jgi:hypothetical protein